MGEVGRRGRHHPRSGRVHVHCAQEAAAVESRSMIVLVRVLYNPVVQWVLLLTPILLLGLILDVPGPGWIGWTLGVIAALGVAYGIGTLRDRLRDEYLRKNPLTPEEQIAANVRAAERINRWH